MKHTATSRATANDSMTEDLSSPFTPSPLFVGGYVGWFNTALKGRGAVALKDIPAGTVMERNPVIVMPREDLYNRAGKTVVIEDYIFCWEPEGPDVEFDLFAFALGHIPLCNHSAAPNADFRQDHRNKLIELIARRDIKRGEEITIDYATDLWFDARA